MKHKLYSLTLAIACLLLVNFAHAQVVVVQHGSTASVFSNLDSAMNAASAGDYLYLSGDLFQVHGLQTSTTDSLHFYKPLHFVGAGIDADSTSVTHETRIQSIPNGTNLGSTVSMGSAAGGSTFDGIVFSGQNLFFENDDNSADSSGLFIFNRCIFNGVVFYTAGNGHYPGNLSVEMHECIVTGGISGAGAGTSSAAFDRCVVVNGPQSESAAVSWTNCVLSDPPGTGTVTNCIIYPTITGFVNQGGTIFTNCLMSGPQPSAGADVFNNCAFNVNDSTVFVNAPTKTWNWANDYHLAAGSPAIGFGSDGHDAGIYGTATPAKPGWVPYNPHFTNADVPGSTDASGNLNIIINVAAQTY